MIDAGWKSDAPSIQPSDVILYEYRDQDVHAASGTQGQLVAGSSTLAVAWRVAWAIRKETRTSQSAGTVRYHTLTTTQPGTSSGARDTNRHSSQGLDDNTRTIPR